MPTPSSDRPSEPPSPDAQGFTTCPDEMQDPPIIDRSDGADEDPSRGLEIMTINARRRPSESRTMAGGASGRDEPPSSGVEISFTSGQRSTAEPSSRATTMSPRPQSTATDGTSPASTILEVDSGKNADPSVSSSRPLPRLPPNQSRPEADSSIGRRSPEQVRSMHSRPESPDTPSDDELYAPSMGSDYSSIRTKAISPSSFLRPGSKFHGTQQSERQVYDVQVEIKHVDVRESFLCGYLRIQGLTEDHPTLTTYFEGEIIGSKYGFITKHEDWGASHKVDLQHWAKFNAFRPFSKQARRGPVTINDISQRENIFMRWKEHFLVPDHRVRTILGASFEGFYYICFNQVKGEVSGIYFHSKSEKYQQLDLKHVPDRGCFSAVEFR